jgi:hypothetical protein
VACGPVAHGVWGRTAHNRSAELSSPQLTADRSQLIVSHKPPRPHAETCEFESSSIRTGIGNRDMAATGRGIRIPKSADRTRHEMLISPIGYQTRPLWRDRDFRPLPLAPMPSVRPFSRSRSRAQAGTVTLPRPGPVWHRGAELICLVHVPSRPGVLGLVSSLCVISAGSLGLWVAGSASRLLSPDLALDARLSVLWLWSCSSSWVARFDRLEWPRGGSTASTRARARYAREQRMSREGVAERWAPPVSQRVNGSLASQSAGWAEVSEVVSYSHRVGRAVG